MLTDDQRAHVFYLMRNKAYKFKNWVTCTPHSEGYTVICKHTLCMIVRVRFNSDDSYSVGDWEVYNGNDGRPQSVHLVVHDALESMSAIIESYVANQLRVRIPV